MRIFTGGKDIDMVNGPLLKNIFIFSLPLMITNLLQMLFNAADTIVVGHYAGQYALAAVGSTGSLVFLLTALFNGIGIGANVVIAKALGSKDHEKTVKALHTALILGFFGGITLTLFSLKARFFLTLMKTPSDIIADATLYMQIVALGAVPMLLYNIAAAALRARGDTKRPMYFLSLSGIINVILNLFFVIVLKWAVKGVAIATVISQICACLAVMSLLLRSDDTIHVDVRKLRIDWPLAWEMLRIGIPSGIQGMAFSISNVVIQSSINSFDSSAIIAGNTAAANIESFIYIGMSAFSQATMTFTSQNLGAGNIKNIKKILHLSLFLSTIAALTISLIVYLNGATLLALYNTEAEVIAVGLIRLFWVGLFLFLNAILDVIVNSLRGMGKALSPTIIMLAGVCILRVLWIYSVFALHHSLNVIYMCYPLSWFCSSIIEYLLWRQVYRHTLNTY